MNTDLESGQDDGFFSATPQGRRAVWSWIMYDWANSAYAMTVLAAFFPIFFNEYWCEGANSTARLGFGNAVAGLLIALVSPFLGALADTGHNRKRFLAYAMLLGVIMSGALYFVAPGAWLTALFVFIPATIGFSCANLFYDSMLPMVSPPGKMDLVSSMGFGFGYLGCGILFAINIAMVLKPQFFGLANDAVAVRTSFLTVSIWWLIFSIPILLFVKEPRAERTIGTSEVYRRAFIELAHTFRSLKKEKGMLLFLFSYWLYIDGVHTFIRMAADLGKSIGLENAVLMRALLLVQLAAFPAAILFGVIAKKIGTLRAILIGIGLYTFITFVAPMTVRGAGMFTFFAVLSAVPQGCLQALSRSYFANIIPKEKAAEYFGFYNLMGKFAVFFGPLMIGVIVVISQSVGARSEYASRLGFSSTSLLFLAGGVMLYFADRSIRKKV
ncbi:MAG: MFS transporter [Chitinivibrionales bacterium]|nr:MFS transporter [Chitinivibrionales bacterium]